MGLRIAAAIIVATGRASAGITEAGIDTAAEIAVAGIAAAVIAGIDAAVLAATGIAAVFQPQLLQLSYSS